ncbi:SPX-domain-containing protein [Microthyrium microscopicum]|uniref:SPX-domain-containing protein n=1 Tax=Microthyrium microscopicum TaxID=703497 RepID=A0A6A6ULH8_9PEZI|nr:SPX-domain-containing protein [Microthyrium microscopicum]
MRFGKQLNVTIYSPWKDQYIDYAKLKKLLRESSSTPDSPTHHDEEDQWTEEDESAFVEELINVQLEKVATFQGSTFQRLRDETADIEKRLAPLGVKAAEDGGSSSKKISDEDRKSTLNDALGKLDTITKETNELAKYSRINYTGFLKAAKKHDRKRGQAYRVGPLLRVRLSALPFNTEDYSPLLYRLSAMYSFVRQSLDGKDGSGLTFEETTSADSYTAYKFWVHPENMLEVKTIILRRLPVLVYNPQTSKIADGTQQDPTVTSLYFDDKKFSLYSEKVDHQGEASSLRLRWYGELDDQTEILIEKKVIKDGGESEEQRFPIKPKYVTPFITGDYKMEKAITKLEDRAGKDSNQAIQLRDAVSGIKKFITDTKVEPMIRANYTRTAFEIPGDDRVRISLDTNLAFIREDALDPDRPCREAGDWHRSDIDSTHMEYPFNTIGRGEVNRFPFALLEIKIRGNKNYEWVEDLMNSHLVKEVTRFSKFVHGTSILFEDYVNAFPFWLSIIDTDIRTDPVKAFQEEKERKAQLVAEEQVIGSLFGSKASPIHRGSLRTGGLTMSPVGSPANSQPSEFRRATVDMTRTDAQSKGKGPAIVDDSDDEDDVPTTNPEASGGLRNLFPSFSTSKFAQRHRPLPPGVTKPTYWLKDQGPLRVEAKVWLANQRTFIKWQHVTVLLASLSLGLYNAAGKDNYIARALAVVYTGFAIFAGAWGYGVYMWRAGLIRKRSATDFDNRLGPIVVCGGLAVALVLNFVFKLQVAFAARDNATTPYINDSLVIPHGGEF